MHIDNPWFKDEYGRALLLRGVNLGGSTKVPYIPNGATYIQKDFFNHREVSFVGRPFPLDEADEHFSRLRAWGLTFLRFLVTWEAIEHAGPGLYDEEYLDYVRAVAEKAQDYGIRFFIDPHQDVWSRFSGGDGAPGWTHEVVGMDMTNFHETGAAFLHQIHGDPFPQMIWPTNATKLAAATMFTLFFAGNDFAPRMQVDGESIQEFLQRHYIDAIKQLAKRLSKLPNVVGYDTMNEPLAGYIGCEDLSKPQVIIELGAVPTPFQSMLLGAGIPQEVEIWERRVTAPKLLEKKLLNSQKKRAWLEGRECVWREHGVWDVEESGRPVLLRSDYFSQVNGHPVDFNRDYYIPFNNRFAKEIREVHPKTIIFVEKGLMQKSPKWDADDAKNVVYAPHWYDAIVLFMKNFTRWLAFDRDQERILLGEERIQASFARQLAKPKKHAGEFMGNVPTIIGETGIPFDMKKKRAYRTGNFKSQTRAMERTLRALDANLLSYTLWNYTADNTNARGDKWNDEDLSIFSRDQQDDPSDIHSGGRALQAVVRPYPLATAGEPLNVSFDIKSKAFEFTFRHDPDVTKPTLIFIPNFQYPKGYQVSVSDGSCEMRTEENILSYRHTEECETHTVRVNPS